MKKSLVLAMAMALGVTASAYAANPFSDVPAGHWAYDSVAKLAAAGVVDGYADGAFAGDKLITRYEMAQIVAKAMAKGADCDKLAAEFADELDTLGVRVAKLEKGADAVKIAGQIRYSYRDVDSKNTGNQNRFRTRLIVKGAINDDWTYTGRMENNQYFHNAGTNTAGKEYGVAGDNDLDLNWAYVSGKIGGVKADLGRQDIKLHGGTVLDGTCEAVKFAYGKDVKVTGVAAKAFDSNKNAVFASDDRVYVADVATKLGVVDAYVTYYNLDNKYDQDIYVVGAAMGVAKNVKLEAEWLNGDSNRKGDDNGYYVGLSYKGAKASVPGSWGAYVKYYDQPWSTIVEPTMDSYAVMPAYQDTDADGYKGFEYGVNYALAKNIVAQVMYYDLEAREGDAQAETLWTQVTFTF